MNITFGATAVAVVIIAIALLIDAIKTNNLEAFEKVMWLILSGVLFGLFVIYVSLGQPPVDDAPSGFIALGICAGLLATFAFVAHAKNNSRNTRSIHY
ncbi:hypothetical protein HY312_01380 [Candidatus Saccharibacteria bacterium]|nr:hypothetical protein [Candidatus Saccharibacteria bacterium]